MDKKNPEFEAGFLLSQVSYRLIISVETTKKNYGDTNPARLGRTATGNRQTENRDGNWASGE